MSFSTEKRKVHATFLGFKTKESQKNRMGKFRLLYKWFLEVPFTLLSAKSIEYNCWLSKDGSAKISRLISSLSCGGVSNSFFCK